jgi:phosphatidylserine/phosphatidylglycerophosphate/cardiolipin synthase-like enzyme
MNDLLEQDVLNFSRHADCRGLLEVARLIEATCGDRQRSEIDSTVSSLSPATLRDDVRSFIIRQREAFGEVFPASFAIRLRSSVKTITLLSQSSSEELVWTGPLPQGCSSRRTEQALVDQIDIAKKELWLASYAYYEFSELSEALERARLRGVAVSMLMEISDGFGHGGVSERKADWISGQQKIQLYFWSKEKRGSGSDNRGGVMHAKFALADRKSILITSANLTDAAMVSNMELGVICRGGDLPAKVGSLLDGLIAKGVIQKWPGEESL